MNKNNIFNIKLSKSMLIIVVLIVSLITISFVNALSNCILPPNNQHTPGDGYSCSGNVLLNTITISSSDCEQQCDDWATSMFNPFYDFTCCHYNPDTKECRATDGSTIRGYDMGFFAISCDIIYCGNSRSDTLEACDGNVLNGETCITQGFTAGILNCDASCNFDNSGCCSGAVTQSCNITNGKGVQFMICNSGVSSYSACVVESCDAGYEKSSNGTSCVLKCGNNKIDTDTGEQCDGTNLNSKTCASVNGKGYTGTLSCKSDCTFNNNSCIAPIPYVPPINLLPGWINTTGNFAIDNATNNLNITGAGILTTDYTFDVFANTTYNFSYNIKKSSDCTVNVSFDNGICLSYTDFTRKPCFISPEANFNNNINITSSKLLKIPINNSDATNGLYFKDVRLKLSFSGACTNVQLSDISLREQKYLDDNVNYDMNLVPTIVTTQENGCCPDDYCWNGTTCLSYLSWVDSQTNGIWSNGNKGYRCIKVENDSAKWVFSALKYDWDNEHTGYCSKTTSCFVGKNFGNINNNYNDCIDNDTIIKDESSVDLNTHQGNHYCYNGAWTTKTYIVAQLLINLTEGKPYVLHCYDDTSVTFNANSNGVIQTSNNPSILSTCVLIKQNPNDKLDEQIITGIITDNSDDSILNELINKYNNPTYKGIIPKPSEYILDDCIDGTHDISGTNFSECFRSNNDKAPMHIYYEKNYKYFIVSEDVVSGFTTPSIWNSVITFFKNLFTTPPIIFNPFASMPLSNYENIYLVNNPNGTIIAIEENKYDQDRKKMMNVILIYYNCANETYNIINKADIINYINKTFYTGDIGINVSDINYTKTPNKQEIIITTEERTGLWPYLTASLRHREDSGFICN